MFNIRNEDDIYPEVLFWWGKSNEVLDMWLLLLVIGSLAGGFFILMLKMGS